MTAPTFGDVPLCPFPAVVSGAKIATAGQTWTCPDCATVWTVIWRVPRGGIPEAVLQATTGPASQPANPAHSFAAPG